MRRNLTFAGAVLLLLPAALLRADDAPPKEFANLDGVWALVKAEVMGKSLLSKEEPIKLVIKEGKVTSDAKDAPKDALELAKVLDSSKKPKAVTLPYEEAVFYGIYEVNGDELRVCGDGVDTRTEKDPEGRRPKEFDSKKGLLLVFKRVKP